jgi:hypothetical protein
MIHPISGIQGREFTVGDFRSELKGFTPPPQDGMSIEWIRLPHTEVCRRQDRLMQQVRIRCSRKEAIVMLGRVVISGRSQDWFPGSIQPLEKFVPGVNICWIGTMNHIAVRNDDVNIVRDRKVIIINSRIGWLDMWVTDPE